MIQKIHNANPKKEKYTAPAVSILKLNDEGLKYLTEDNKFSQSTLDAFGIGSHESGLILIPVRDENIQHVRTLFRNTCDELMIPGDKKAAEFQEGGTKPVLLGSHLAHNSNGALNICFDSYGAMSLYEAGVVNATAAPIDSNDWIEIQYEWLTGFSEINLWIGGKKLEGDAKKAHDEWITNLVSRLGWERTKVIRSEFENPADAFKTHDADYINDAIESAEFLHYSGLVDLSTQVYEHADGGLSTSFRSLDKIINGIQKKRVYILAGSNGHGKSTIGLQMISEFIDQGAKCFFWPGEQSTAEIVSWVDVQIAKEDQTRIAVSRFGTDYPIVKNECLHDVRAEVV